MTTITRKSGEKVTLERGEVNNRVESLKNNPQARKPWDRLTDESTMYYGWFKTYRDLGKPPNGRTLEKFAKTLGLPSINGNIQRISQKYEWVERCRLWDNYMTDKEAEAANRVLEAKAREVGEDWGKRQNELRQRQYEVGYKLLRHVERRLLAAEGIGIDEQGNETQITPEPMKLYDKDYVMMAKAAISLMATAIAPPKQGLAEEDEFANMPSDPSEWSESDLVRYKARMAKQAEQTQAAEATEESA